MTTAQLPSGATMVNTTKVLQQVTDYYLTKEKDNVQSVFTVGGFGFSGRGKTTARRLSVSSRGLNVSVRKTRLPRSFSGQ